MRLWREVLPSTPRQTNRLNPKRAKPPETIPRANIPNAANLQILILTNPQIDSPPRLYLESQQYPSPRSLTRYGHMSVNQTQVEQDEDGRWSSWIEELPGCAA